MLEGGGGSAADGSVSGGSGLLLRELGRASAPTHRHSRQHLGQVRGRLEEDATLAEGLDDELVLVCRWGRKRTYGSARVTAAEAAAEQRKAQQPTHHSRAADPEDEVRPGVEVSERARGS